MARPGAPTTKSRRATWAWLVAVCLVVGGALTLVALDPDDRSAQREDASAPSLPGGRSIATVDTLGAITETTVAAPPTTPSSVATTEPIVSSRTPMLTTVPTTPSAATVPPTTPASTAATVAPTAPPTQPATQPALPGFGDGTHLVGTDVQPGRYVANAPGASCYWERLASLTGAYEDIIASDVPRGRGIVEVLPTDVALNTSGCGAWVLFVPGTPVTRFGDGDWAVGADVVPGVYVTEGGSGCYWERATGFTHDFGEVIASELPQGPVTLEIAADDVRFSTRECGIWTQSG